jgi:hypothetical protein
MFHLLHFGFSAVAIVITVLVAIWVYNDAEKRGGNNSILWAIGTFFCCPIVPIIYLIVRK